MFLPLPPRHYTGLHHTSAVQATLSSCYKPWGPIVGAGGRRGRKGRRGYASR